MEARPSYHQLIIDHDQIEAAALEVIADLEGMTVLADDIFLSIGKLADTVRSHLQNEEALLSNLSQSQLNGLPMHEWKEAANDFDQLKEDWLGFLRVWDLEAIKNNRIIFGASARSILARLNDRVRFETETLYAAALQSGVIRLR